MGAVARPRVDARVCFLGAHAEGPRCARSVFLGELTPAGGGVSYLARARLPGPRTGGGSLV